MRNKNDAKSEVVSFTNALTIPIFLFALLLFLLPLGRDDSTISDYEDTIAYYEEENSILKGEIEELNIFLERLEEDYDDLEEDYYNLQKEFEAYKKNNFFFFK